MIEIRREGDEELCGCVVERDGRWTAMTVFGGHLGEHDTRADAERQVRSDGLASLAERWNLLDRESGTEEVVLIQEADPNGVTLALGYYSLPGVPTVALTRDDLVDGRWVLTLR